MSVTRNDLIEQKALYTLPSRDGLWKVHDYNEQPTITMHNIETGELHSFEMTSMDNRRCERVRYIESGDKIKAPNGKEIEIKLDSGDSGSTTDTELLLMLNDATQLVQMILEKDRPNKELKEQLAAWNEQVVGRLADEIPFGDGGEDE